MESTRCHHWRACAVDETPGSALFGPTIEEKVLYETAFYDEDDGIYPNQYPIVWKLIIAENGGYYWATPNGYEHSSQIRNELETEKKRKIETCHAYPSRGVKSARTGPIIPDISPLVSDCPVAPLAINHAGHCHTEEALPSS